MLVLVNCMCCFFSFGFDFDLLIPEILAWRNVYEMTYLVLLNLNSISQTIEKHWCKLMLHGTIEFNGLISACTVAVNFTNTFRYNKLLFCHMNCWLIFILNLAINVKLCDL